MPYVPHPTLPSVTKVMGPFADFSKVPKAVLAHAAARGTRVHAACAAIAQGVFVLPPGDEEAPYVESFQRWFDAAVVEVVASEVELVDEDLGFCGHPDLIVRIEGDKGLSLPDIKTPATKNKLWRCQLAAYRHLAETNGYHPIDRIFSLRLKKDGGRAIVDEYDKHPNDFQGFLAALSAYRYFNGV